MAKPKKTAKANKGRKIAFFDTTLRDGEQAPGFSMSAELGFSTRVCATFLGRSISTGPGRPEVAI